MVVVPPGSFAMGSDRDRPEEKPSHQVTVPGAFAIGAHEITVAQWDACLKEGGCRHSPEPGRDGRLPMANVSWNDAQDYLKWLRGKDGAGLPPAERGGVGIRGARRQQVELLVGK
jgi:formylglycine-generating enzyme required for sulfatase activity